ncbi:MAG: monooxygenase [Alphaproteobacteria bacterium]|nr:monooxygenase [Alphaproteobacteria bacterium]
MRIAVLGSGPAGLYFSTLWKQRHPADTVATFEQSPAGATWGFGVVFSGRALDFLRGDDPETWDLITPRMETWQGITLFHPDGTVAIDGIGFSAIGRLELLLLLQDRARATGVELHFDRPVASLDGLQDADLIVGADGLNSVVRRAHEGDFAMSLSYLANKFAWYGTTKVFETLSHTFVTTKDGPFNAHHYRYAPGMSTFLVETDRDTWLRAGFATLDEAASRAKLEAIFAGALDGRPLISNRSAWRNFPLLWNDRWSHLNRVLVGDALHTAHFSIGAGTRLAIEDAIALMRALEDHPGDLRAGLEAYEAARRPVVANLVRAAGESAAWYENFGTHMKLAPLDFAYSYITRSGRIDNDRLRAVAPAFMARYEARKAK